MTTLRFGVNYTPRQKWFYSWHDMDWDSVESDMATIAGLGMDHVRLFPLWPVLQPNRSFIDPKAVADVRRMVDIADSHGLDVYVDVLQGHLSSFDFVPSWLSSWHSGNMFTDPEIVEAEALLTRALHSALRDVPRYRGLTLGNELNQFSGSPHPSPMRATPDEVDGWLDALLSAVPESDGVTRLHAEYDAVWYMDGHPFLPRHASRAGDMTVIHSWIFNGTAQHYGSMSPESLRHAEYLVELSRAFATDAQRDVWLQEIGAPHNVLDDADVLDFATAAVCHAADSPRLWGVTWWCSHDVDPSLGDFPPFEHSLGLIDAEGKVKPLGHRFAALAEQLREREAAAERRTAVVIPVDEDDTPVMRAALAPGGSLFNEWMRLAEAGARPTFVTSNTAASEDELHRLGIMELHRVELSAGTAYSGVSDEAFLDAEVTA